VNLIEEHIPALKIEPCEDGTLMLEQEWSGNVDRIAIHPLHVRYMAERFGLAEASDIEAHRTIARLARRLQALNGRVRHLAERLAARADADGLPYEQAHAQATADLASEFCSELPPHLDAQALAAQESAA
jgi:hypothetical protein